MLSEKPSVILEVKLCVTEEGYITREEEIVCDAYSTEFSSLPEFEQLKITGEVVPINEPHMEKCPLRLMTENITNSRYFHRTNNCRGFTR